MLPRIATLSIAAVLLLSGCGSDDGAPKAVDDGPTTTCSYTADGQSAAKEVDPPSEEASAAGTVHADLATSVGDIGLELDAAGAPCTVHSFVSLAKQGYFDQTSCHRLTTEGIHVLQCGDPTGTGSGGPGYSFADELEGDETYPAGTLAMANAGPDTNGSQFFIVYGDTPLPASYTVFGTVDDAGLKVVQEVGADGVDKSAGVGATDGPPATPVDITSVTVEG